MRYRALCCHFVIISIQICASCDAEMGMFTLLSKRLASTDLSFRVFKLLYANNLHCTYYPLNPYVCTS
uniref:Uncharacterized protein n=1 Tax=Arundo donax TaxID=35708 RepID=A0A0A9NNQ6_ARUDO